MLVVSWFISNFVAFIVHNYLFCLFANNKKFKINFIMLFLASIMGLIFYFVTKFISQDYIYIRPYIAHLYIFICLLFIYKDKFVKTLIILLSNIILSFIAEFIFGFVAVLVFKVNGSAFNSIWYDHLLANIFIYLLTILLAIIPLIKRIFKNIINWYNNNEFKLLMISVTICIILFTFLLYNNFLKLLPSSILLLTNLFCIGVAFFVINYFKEKANNNRIITEYDQLLDYVKKYEKLIEEKSKNQHEYKNQLALIKGMIPKTNKKVLNYIDELYSEQKDNNDIELLKKLQYLPTGGLKGLIYYKLEEMFDKKLKVYIDISPSIKNEKISKKLDKNLKDISKVIGVYMDNAMEAAIKTKEKYVVLEVYIENNEFVFSLSNSYNNQISLNKIDNGGYSTKGDGHGYGLSLVKDIIEKNKDIRQERSINGIYYVQKLYIKK